MNRSAEYELISVCDVLIERRQYQEALQLLEKTQGVVSTWLKGKVHLSMAQATSQDYMFQHYATMEMKFKYRDTLNEAHAHLFTTAMELLEASVEIREYLNQYLWRQLGQAENELAKTKYWFPQEGDEDDENAFKEDEKSWTPDPEALIDYFTDWKM